PRRARRGSGDPRGLPAALPSDHDDDLRGDLRRAADRARHRRGRRAAPAARRRGRGRPLPLAAAHPLHHAGRLPLPRSRRPPAQAASRSAARRGPAGARASRRRGGVIDARAVAAGKSSLHHGRDARLGIVAAEADVARVKMIPPDAAEGETKRVYDRVLAQWGRISNFSRVLGHQPAALEGWALPNDAIRLVNVKSDPDYVKIQQLVIIKTSALNQSAYCMSHNVPLGKKMGLSEAQIAAARGNDYMTSPDLDDRQKAAVRWADAVTRMTARDDDEA